MSCSYHDRQEDELLFLKEIFPKDFEDLRKKDPWKMNRPPEFRVRIVPEKSNDLRDKLYAVLRAKYPTNYPDDVPEVVIEDCKGISDAAKSRLDNDINSLLKDLVGEVMMFQVIQHTQAFLDSNDQQKLPSLYEEMLLRRKKEEVEKEKRLKQEHETKEMNIEREINEEFKRQAELRGGRTKKLSVIKQEEMEARIDTLVKGNSPTAGKRSPNVPQRAVSLPNNPKAQDITRGKLLGSSSCGHSVYVGMDSVGELVAVYEWTLHCRPAKKNQAETGMVTSRRSKQVQSIQQELYSLRGMAHKNLASYHSMTFRVEADTIFVRLCMEYVQGSNLNHLVNEEGKSFAFEKIKVITGQILEGLAHLHSQGVVHKDLRLSLVFLDASESVKLAGYAVLKRLSDLHKAVNAQQKMANGDEGLLPVTLATDQIGGKRGDLLKLGLLVLSMVNMESVSSPPKKIPANIPDVVRDFIVRCLNMDEFRSLSYRDLLVHPFITTTTTVGMSTSTKMLHHQPSFHLADSPQYPQDKFVLLGSPVKSQASFPQPQKSRLKSEFEELEHLGQGGFGDVIKVRNHLDGRIYAIKRVRLHPELKAMNRKIMREVKLLSQLNHENVVRYYNAWIESYSHGDLPVLSILEEDEESLMNLSGRSQASSIELDGRKRNFDSDDDDDESSSGDDDDFISFEVPSVSNDNNSEVVVFEDENSNTTLSSGSGGGGDSTGHSFDESTDMMFSMSPSEYALDTKNILALIDRDAHASDQSDPVVWHRSLSKEAMDKNDLTPKQQIHRPGSSHFQIRYLYIQMEFCENRTLRHLIDGGELHQDEDLLWRLLREITEGLNHIHKQGMIHRDLKPGNIFLDINARVKIGDFGLATSYGFTRKASMIPPGEMSMMEYMGKQDFSGPVGTFLYTSPEILNVEWEGKFTQKIDIYSLGIIFFEMCQPPCVTEMERQILLTEVRKDPPVLPAAFQEPKMKNKHTLLYHMLEHNPHKRPSAEDILQSDLLPAKMEDKELLEVLTRTLSSTNSTSYQKLMQELFKQSVSRVNEFTYFYDLQEMKCTLAQTLLHQRIRGKIQSVFEKHNAVHLATPLLMPKCHQVRDTENLVVLMDHSGGLIVLPYDLRVPLAKFVAMHDITDLRRFTIDCVYRESGLQRLNFNHPREAVECAFDIITGDTKQLIPDAECIGVVWEIINEFPALKAQNYVVHLNHVSLLKAVLDQCSVPSEKQKDLLRIHHLLSTGGGNIEDVLSKELKITKLAATQLAKFVSCGVSLCEAKSRLEHLLKDRTPIGTLANQGWHEIETIVTHLVSMGINRDMVLVNIGMVQNINMYCGVLFQFRKLPSSQLKRKHKKHILAAGGRYDRLISSFQVPSRTKTGRPIRGVGVSLSEDHVFSVMSKTQCSTPQQMEIHTGSAVLVHWLGLEPCSEECIKVASTLWRKGIPTQLFYSAADTIDELWTYCQRNSISCLVVLVDRFYKEKNQMKVRTNENGRVLEKLVNGKDLVDYILQKQKEYIRNSDTPELISSTTKQTSLSMNDLNAPQINFSVVSLQKIPGHIKRKLQDQAYNKVAHVVQRLKCPAEVLSVELDGDALSSIVLTLNKQPDLKDGSGDVVRQVCDRCPKVNKKLVSKLCEEIYSLLTDTKSPLVILHSTESLADHVQVLLNVWD